MGQDFLDVQYESKNAYFRYGKQLDRVEMINAVRRVHIFLSRFRGGGGWEIEIFYSISTYFTSNKELFTIYYNNFLLFYPP